MGRVEMAVGAASLVADFGTEVVPADGGLLDHDKDGDGQNGQGERDQHLDNRVAHTLDVDDSPFQPNKQKS